MRFTNPSFDELTDDEIIEQQRILAPLREAHMQQIVGSGLASRLLSSTSMFNNTWNMGTLSEGSMLYPFRTYIWNLPPERRRNLGMDLGYSSRAVGEQDKLNHVMGAHADNYVLMVGRREPIVRGASKVHLYAAGLLLQQQSANLMGLSERDLPVEGVRHEDMRMLERQLGEIAAFADENNLTLIDRVTLGEGKGTLILSEPQPGPPRSDFS
jgi:hypothetical protein